MAGSFLDSVINAINDANSPASQQPQQQQLSPNDILANALSMIRGSFPQQQGEAPDILNQIMGQPSQQDQTQVNEYNPYQATYYADPYYYAPQQQEMPVEQKKPESPLSQSAPSTSSADNYPSPSISDVFDNVLRAGTNKAFGAQAVGTPSEDLTENDQQVSQNAQQAKEDVNEIFNNAEQEGNTNKSSRKNEDEENGNTQSMPNVRIPIPGLGMTQDSLQTMQDINGMMLEAGLPGLPSMQDSQQTMQDINKAMLEEGLPGRPQVPSMQVQNPNSYIGAYLADPLAFDPMTSSARLNSLSFEPPEVTDAGGVGKETTESGAGGSKTQRENFVDALASNPELRSYYQGKYGDNLVGDYGYEWYRYLPSGQDMSSKAELVRDLYLDPTHSIAGWDAYLPSMGVDRNNMSEEDMVNAILNYMWSPENMIDLAQYMANNNDYRNTHLLGSDDAAAYMGRFLADNNFRDELLRKLPEGTQGDFFDLLATGGKGNSPFKLDSKDLGNIFMQSNLLGKEAAGLLNKDTFTEKDLARVASMLQQAGDNMAFYFTDENDPNAFNFKDSDNSYVIGNYLAGLPYDAIHYGEAEYTPVIDVYNGVGNEQDNLASAHLADDVMSLVKRNTGRSIGRTPKKQ